MIKNLSNLSKNENLTIPGAILLLVILAYGIFIPWLGFYWDDWPFAWLLRSFGPAEFIAAFSTNRPLLGPIFMLTTSLFGSHPLVWQAVGLGVRFLLSLELFYLLKLVFPSQKTNILWVVFLFTVYPGYGQQWVALTHVNQEWIPLLFLLSSFLISIRALRNPRAKSLIPLAIGLQILGLFSTEYFFGLEIIRFLFILKIRSEKFQGKNLISEAIKSWLPYLAIWVLNALWLFWFYQSGAYRSYGVELSSSSLLSPLALINEFINTFSLTTFTSWAKALDLFAPLNGSLIQFLIIAVFLGTAVLLFFWMPSNSGHLQQKGPVQFGWWALGIGFVGIFAGRLPSWAAGFPLRLEFDYDRFFVSMMLGASLFIIGLADLILKQGKGKLLILSLLIALCVSQQVQRADTFRQDWANQRAFFWELAWRIPALKENTVLLADELPLDYVFDLHLTAPISWIYSPSRKDHVLPSMLLYIRSRLDSSLPSLQPGVPISIKFRTAEFDGNTSQSLTIYKETGGCLRVLDPVYENAETLIAGRKVLADAIRLSDPSLIDASAPNPVLDVVWFGPEPEHGWCYFYAKAGLFRQQGDWESVVNLYQEADQGGLTPGLPVENLPFIEAFARSGNLDQAIALTERTAKAQPALCAAIVDLWERVPESAYSPDCD